MSTQRTLAGMVGAAILTLGAGAASASPAPDCGSRLRTVKVELRAATQESQAADAAAKVEKLAERLHLSVVADMARDRETEARQEAAATIRAAVHTLLGADLERWPAAAGAAPTCPTT